MHVVDRVKVVVLVVPAEGREEHPEVQPRRRDPGQLLAPTNLLQVPQQRARLGGHHVEVPRVGGVGVLGMLGGEAGAYEKLNRI